MITFGIPFRSKASSSDWEQTIKIFQRTMHSVFGQTDEEFQVILACHDIPPFDEREDKRLKILVSPTKIPKNKEEMMMDKGFKMGMIATEFRNRGGGYLMMVDSDDLISNQIATYVKKHPNENGFVSQFGYVYREGDEFVKKTPHMYHICGSCSIVHYSPEDLPPKVPANLYDDGDKDKYLVRMPHPEIPERLREEGKSLSLLPFISTIYVRNTGDNHSMLGGSDLGRKRKLQLMLSPKIRLAKEIKDEFFGGTK